MIRSLLKLAISVAALLLAAATAIVKIAMWVLQQFLVDLNAADTMKWRPTLLTLVKINDSGIDPIWRAFFGLFGKISKATMEFLGQQNPQAVVEEKTTYAVMMWEFMKNPFSWLYLVLAVLLVMTFWSGPRATWRRIAGGFSLLRIITFVGLAGIAFVVANNGWTIAEQAAPLIFVAVLLALTAMFIPRATGAITRFVTDLVPLGLYALLIFFGVGAASGLFGVNILGAINSFIPENSVLSFIPAIAQAGSTAMATVDLPDTLKMLIVFCVLAFAIPLYNWVSGMGRSSRGSHGGEHHG